MADPDDDPREARQSATAPWFQAFRVLFSIPVFIVVIGALYEEFQQLSVAELLWDVTAYPLPRIGIAFAFTVGAYAVLTRIDVLGFEYLSRSERYRRLLLPSFVGYALSNNVGISFVVSGSVRSRIYTSLGVHSSELRPLLGFTFVTYWPGFCGTLGPILLFGPSSLVPDGLASGRPVGALLLSVVGVYVLLAGRRDSLTIRRRTVRVPGHRVAVVQVILGVANWILNALVLFALLSWSVTDALGLFERILVASFVGAVAPVPGGIGAFEATFLAIRPPAVPQSEAVAALLVYRTLYYLLPLVVAIVVVAIRVVRERRSRTEHDMG